MPRTTRQRMLDSAVRLFREHGYNGEGVSEILMDISPLVTQTPLVSPSKGTARGPSAV